jgi:hypothetical protein
MVRDHLEAVVDGSRMLLAIADGDLALARKRAASAYRVAISAEDMPLLAGVGSGLAFLAHALGESGRAAEILGACTPVRGMEDPTDLAVTRLEPQLRAALGAENYARAYARGQALSRAEAVRFLDPAGL